MVRARSQRIEACAVESVAFVQCTQRSVVGAADTMVDRVGVHVFRTRHARLEPEFFTQPGGKPDVIGVTVRNDKPPRRPTVETACKDLLPQRARGVGPQAAIDDSPAGPILEQPQIDMFEGERQWHAQPEHARTDLLHGAGSR